MRRFLCYVPALVVCLWSVTGGTLGDIATAVLLAFCVLRFLGPLAYPLAFAAVYLGYEPNPVPGTWHALIVASLFGLVMDWVMWRGLRGPRPKAAPTVEILPAQAWDQIEAGSQTPLPHFGRPAIR